jgi:hypothetical protein
MSLYETTKYCVPAQHIPLAPDISGTQPILVLLIKKATNTACRERLEKAGMGTSHPAPTFFSLRFFPWFVINKLICKGH